MDYAKYLGFYRARVVDPMPPTYYKYGAVRISIPDFMQEDICKDSEGSSIDLYKNGLIAYPANNPVGGRNLEDPENTSYYQGAVYVPPKNSYVWIFFEGGLIERPFYFSAFDSKAVTLPPEQITVDEPYKVFTVLKTRQGRTIVVSDDTDTQRVEITGKKRKLSGDDPAGNEVSTYTIDENMTTILLDERLGKEKLLIRTYLGDYLHIDIDQRKLHVEFENDINIKTKGNLSIDVKKNIHIKSGGATYLYSQKDFNIKSDKEISYTSGALFSLDASGYIRINGSRTMIQSGPGRKAITAKPNQPIGERDS